jgi:hypothetical protein
MIEIKTVMVAIDLADVLTLVHWEDQRVWVRAVLPKRFSTTTQFLERQSIATHIALLDKKKSSSKTKKNIFYIFLNIILQKNSMFLIMRRV